MRFLYTLILLTGLALSADAQFGVTTRYQFNTNKIWNDIYNDAVGGNTKIMSSGLEYGLNYWFRLKNQRIEFLPEIFYSRVSDNNFIGSQPLIKATRDNLGFALNTQIYPLDFNNDCNCPTFSKTGSFFTKGFYWLVSPGVSLSKTTTVYRLNGTSTGDNPDNYLALRLGLGAGLDFGIIDVLTLSPYILYDVSFGHEWDTLAEVYDLSPETETTANISQLQFGLRLMFRPDYVRKNRR